MTYSKTRDDFHVSTFGSRRDTETCSMPQVCFQCKQTCHVKRFYPLLSGSGSIGPSSGQPRAPVQGFGQLAVRPTIAPRFEVGSSFGAQGAQRSQASAQTHIFAMTVGEA